MKRKIIVGKEFVTYVKTPLIADDVQAYCIVWKIGNEAKGAGLLVNAKRSDGVTVTDFGTVDKDGVGEYVLAGNMYSVTGSLEIRLSVVSETTTLTEKMLVFDVIAGNGNESIESEDNVPLLTTVLAKTAEAVAKAENIPQKVSQLENDCGFLSEVTSENIVKGSITPEKTTFYEELNALNKQLFLKTVALEPETFIRDKIQNSVIDKIEIGGYSFQNNSIITYLDQTITSGNLTIECKRDGRMILNGSLDAGETVIINIPQVTFYASNIYKSSLTFSDESKKGTIFVIAENLIEGDLTGEITCEKIKIIQGSIPGNYDNFEMCYTIFEENRKGENIYPIYGIDNVNVALSGKNRISVDDITPSSYCTVEKKEGGVILEGKYYALLSDNFFNRLEKGCTYTLSFKRNYTIGSGASNVPRININYEDGTATQWTILRPTAVLENKKIIAATIFFSGSSNVRCEIANLMFEEGNTATEYEEFIPDAIINIPDVNLHRIGSVYDKLVIGKEIYLENYIQPDNIDETQDIDNQKGAVSLFPVRTKIGDNMMFDKFKGKTVKISLKSETRGENSVTYCSES